MSNLTSKAPKGVKHITRPFEIKSVDENGRFTGYGSVFGELDSYRDIVMPGAFKDSLKEDFQAKKRLVPMLWQHDWWSPIGVYPVIEEDKVGLYLEGECNKEVQKGAECHALMKQGALTGLSIGYTTVTSEWDEENLIRKLIKVNLWEVSPVTFPAGDSARINHVKSFAGFTTLSECEDALRDAGFSTKEAVTLMSRIKALAPSTSDSADADALRRIKSILNNI
jgi:HK97 family phage prohead protease